MLSSITWEGVMWIFLIFSPAIGLACFAIAGFFLGIKHPKPNPKDAQPTPAPDA